MQKFRIRIPFVIYGRSPLSDECPEDWGAKLADWLTYRQPGPQTRDAISGILTS